MRKMSNMSKTGLSFKVFFLLLLVMLILHWLADVNQASDANVSRTAGADRYQTSAEVAVDAFEAAETVIIASGDDDGDFADGLAAGVLSGVLDAPILLTSPDFLPDTVESAVEKLEADQAIILGGTRAVSAAVENSLRAAEVEVDRIAGKTRQETATLIAEKARESGKLETSAFIVNGHAPADSLVAGPAAFKNHLPILQVREGEIPPVTEEAIENWGIDKFYIVGGEAVVSNAVEEDLSARGRVERLAGEHRYATGVKVSQAMFPETNNYSIVGGANYADAIGAAVFGEPILYVQTASVPAAVENYLEKRLSVDSRVNVFGGSAAVSETVAETVGEKIAPREVVLEITGVRDISTTSVEVEFKQTREVLEGVTVEVEDPQGEVYPVEAKDLEPGTSGAEFSFREEPEDIHPGTWVAKAAERKIEFKVPAEKKEELRFFVDPEKVNLEGKIDDHFKFSKEQLDRIENGAETVPLREEQVEGIKQHLEKTKENARQSLDHRTAADIENVLKTGELFTEEDEANLQVFREAASQLYDALDPLEVKESEVKESAAMTDDSGEEIDLHEIQEPSLAGNEVVKTYYAPGYKDEDECDDYFLQAYDNVVDLSAGGYGIEGESNACEKSGAVGGETHAWVGSVKSYGRQQVKIDVPIGTDVEIITRIRHNTGTSDFGYGSFSGTKETVQDIRNNWHTHTIDPGLSWDIAAEKAIDIVADLTPGVPPSVGAAIDAIDLIDDFYETYHSLDPEEEGIEESTKIYEATHLPEGTYYFDVGLEAKSAGCITGYANAFAFGQVYEVEVRKDLPYFNMEIPQGSQELAEESSVQLTAQAEFPQDYVKEVTGKAQWSSTNPAVASVEEGLVETESMGSATIEAEYGGETTSVEVEVVDEFGLSVVADEPPGEGKVIVKVEEKDKQWEITDRDYIGEFKKGTEIKLEAVPDEGYLFDYWMGIESNTPVEFISMHEPTTVRAKFAEDTVVKFEDPHLEEAVREAIDKPTGIIYQSEVANLEQLFARGRGIESLEGIQYLKGLTDLHLGSIYDSDEEEWKFNQISNLEPLSELENLGRLRINSNEIEDVSPLSGLTNLYNLDLSSNSISDISPLTGLTELSMLFIDRNQVNDISSLLNINYQRDDVYIDMEYNDLDLREGLEDVQNIKELEDMGIEVDHNPLIDLVDLVIPEGEQTLEAGETFQFTTKAVYENDTQVEVTGKAQWECDDTDIVEIDEDGKVMGIDSGSTTIYAEWKGKAASETVNVENGKIENNLTGKVTGGDPPENLTGAEITVYDNGEEVASTTCDHMGNYEMQVPPGTYDVEADSAGYIPETKEDVEMKRFIEVELNFYLNED